MKASSRMVGLVAALTLFVSTLAVGTMSPASAGDPYGTLTPVDDARTIVKSDAVVSLAVLVMENDSYYTDQTFVCDDFTTDPAFGVTVVKEGSDLVVSVAPDAAAGIAYIAYGLCTPDGFSDTRGTLSLTVEDFSSAPVAVEDDFRRLTMFPEDTVRLPVVQNDKDSLGRPLSVAYCSRVGSENYEPVAQCVPDGDVVVLKLSRLGGPYTVTFDYTITNGLEISKPAKVVISVDMPFRVPGRRIKGRPGTIMFRNRNSRPVVVEHRSKRPDGGYTTASYRIGKNASRIVRTRNPYNLYRVSMGSLVIDSGVVRIWIKKKRR